MKKDIKKILNDRVVNETTPGFSIAVVKNGKVIYEKQEGLSNLKNQQKISKRTNFRLASLSKQFTATAILQLVEKGLLDLHTPVSNYLKAFPRYGKDITPYHLLTHTSGLKHYEKIISSKRNKPIQDKGVLLLLKKENKLLFKPGSRFNYSNGGYCILKLLIEEITNISFARYLRKNIFLPIGMKNTVVNENNKSSIKYRAIGYSENKKDWILNDQGITTQTQGDGSIYSSMIDLIKWDQALYTKKLLSKKSLKIMLKNGQLNSGNEIKNSDGSYCLGWYSSKINSLEIFTHGGETIGFRTGIVRVPSKKLSVIFLSNRDDFVGSAVVRNLLKMFIE